MQAAVPTSATFTVPFCIRPDPDEGGSFGPPVDSSFSTRRTWYFGIWIHKAERKVLSYIEGDIYFTQCADAESYDRRVAEMCESYPPAAAFVVLQEDGRTDYYQDRSELFIDPERFTGSEPDGGD